MWRYIMERLLITDWDISANNYCKDDLEFYESIFSQGNGYVGIRGYISEGKKINRFNRSSFLAGFFEYIKPNITDMVNIPDMFATRIFIGDDEVDFEKDQISEFNQTVSMKNGLLIREYIHTSNKISTKIRFERIVSVDNIHQIAVRYTITPINHNNEVTLHTGIDGDVANNPIADEQLTENTELINLWDIKHINASKMEGNMHLQTRYSKRELAVAYKLTANEQSSKVKSTYADKSCINVISIKTTQGKPEIFNKFISLYSYRDQITKDILQDSILTADDAASKGFDQMLCQNTNKWEQIWNIADIEIDGDSAIQGAIRYNIFQMIQTYNDGFPYASIGARGIMHGRYKGCYFWDAEVFILPFYMYTNPNAAKNMLLYRYNTLEDAKTMAKNNSLQGARYSWMCSDTGNEQCETWDTGSCEVHITADVAYAVDKYIKTQNDNDFLINYGCEMLVETARYWVSRLTYDEREDKYNMLFVKGPDEYCGVTINNTYTNFMTMHNLECAIKGVENIQELAPEKWKNLSERISFDEEEIDKWNEIVTKISINYDKENDLYIEDDLFLKTEPIDIEKYKDGDKPLYKSISYDKLQRYRVIKQADIIQLMIMHPQSFTENQKRAAWEFYEPLTLHDSTLSFGSHAEHAAKIGEMDKAQMYFMKSLFLDLKDIMGNTAREGLHTAALGATWKSIIYGFAGLDDTGEELALCPNLPQCIDSIKFKVFYKGDLWKANITKDKSDLFKC